jgi:hypothetical protein
MTSNFRYQQVQRHIIRLFALFVVFALIVGSSPHQVSGTAATTNAELPFNAMPVMANAGPLQGWLNAVNTDRLMRHVLTLESFKTRHINSSYVTPGQGIGAARDYLMNHMGQIAKANPNFTVNESGFQLPSNYANSKAFNIVGVLTGTDASEGVIVVGAHYDSTTTAWMDGIAYAPGANDNASGTAALLELAQIMVEGPQPRETVIFVAFAAEEAGRLGSIDFVKNYLPQHHYNPSAMLNMDIIGSNTDPNGAINPSQIRLFSAEPNNSPSRSLARHIHLANVLYPHDEMQVLVQNAVDRQGRYGDHMSFNDAGYAAVRFIEPLEDTYRQHSANDTSDDIQPQYLTRSTQTVLVSLITLAHGPAAPQNITVNTSAQTPILAWDNVPEAKGYVIAFSLRDSLIYDEYVEVTTTSIGWEGLLGGRYGSVAIAAQDETGLIGPFSGEIPLG